MAPSKGIIVLGCFLLTSPVLPPALAPGRAIPALLSLSHPPCALISLHTLNWCCPARPGSFPGFVLSVESGEDSKSLSLCLSQGSQLTEHPSAQSWSCRLGPCPGCRAGNAPGIPGRGQVQCLPSVLPAAHTPRASPPSAHPTAERREQGMSVLAWDGAGLVPRSSLRLLSSHPHSVGEEAALCWGTGRSLKF